MLEAMTALLGVINTIIFLAHAVRLSVERALLSIKFVVADTIEAIAGHLAFPAAPLASGIGLPNQPIGGRGSAWQWKANPPVRRAALLRLGGLKSSDPPVRVLFEIGRIDLALDEIERLEVGAILPLIRGADFAVNIVMSGKRIGRGELVRIGKKVSVRVTRLFDLT